MSAAKGQRELCNLGGSSHAAGGNFLNQGFPFFLGEAAVHVGIDDTAGDGVDGDTAGSKLLAQCLGERMDSALAGRVSNLAGGTDAAPNGGDIDDVSAFSCDHLRNAQTAC